MPGRSRAHLWSAGLFRTQRYTHFGVIMAAEKIADAIKRCCRAINALSRTSSRSAQTLRADSVKRIDVSRK